jgi:hypothetical protein
MLKCFYGKNSGRINAEGNKKHMSGRKDVKEIKGTHQGIDDHIASPR